jgi:peptide/nickel transport system permease protein
LSLRQGAKVSRLIAERFPATLELALIAALLALIVGIRWACTPRCAAAAS